MTLSQQFKAEAKRLMPEHDDLQDMPDSENTVGEIDEIMFHHSEYIGGMAAVILSLIEGA